MKHARIIILLLAFLLTACNITQKNKEELIHTRSSASDNFKTAECVISDLHRTSSSQGIFIQTREDILFTGDAKGILTSIKVANRQSVEAGDTLAIIKYDTSLYATDLEKSKVIIENAEKTLQAEKKTWEENMALLVNDLRDMTPQEVQMAGLRIEKAKLEFEWYVYDAEQKIRQLNQDMERLLEKFEEVIITAPESGTIANIMYLEGAEIEPGRVVMSIDRIDPMRRLAMSSTPANFRYNMEVMIDVRGEKYPGRVVSNPMADGFGFNQSSVTFIVAFDDPDLLKSVETANTSCTIMGTRDLLTDVMVVPNEAIFEVFRRKYVQLLEDGVIKKRYVQTGLSTSEVTQIITGLKPRDRVLLKY